MFSLPSLPSRITLTRKGSRGGGTNIFFEKLEGGFFLDFSSWDFLFKFHSLDATSSSNQIRRNRAFFSFSFSNRWPIVGCSKRCLYTSIHPSKSLEYIIDGRRRDEFFIVSLAFSLRSSRDRFARIPFRKSTRDGINSSPRRTNRPLRGYFGHRPRYFPFHPTIVSFLSYFTNSLLHSRFFEIEFDFYQIYPSSSSCSTMSNRRS